VEVVFKEKILALMVARGSKNCRINFQEEGLIKLELFGNFRKRDYFRRALRTSSRFGGQSG